MNLPTSLKPRLLKAGWCLQCEGSQSIVFLRQLLTWKETLHNLFVGREREKHGEDA